MLTPSQTRKIKFTDGVSVLPGLGDFVSYCRECTLAGEPFTIVTPHRDGIAMHNRRKAAHREKHEWGQLRSPSFEKETTS